MVNDTDSSDIARDSHQSGLAQSEMDDLGQDERWGQAGLTERMTIQSARRMNILYFGKGGETHRPLRQEARRICSQTLICQGVWGSCQGQCCRGARCAGALARIGFCRIPLTVLLSAVV